MRKYLFVITILVCACKVLSAQTIDFWGQIYGANFSYPSAVQKKQNRFVALYTTSRDTVRINQSPISYPNLPALYGNDIESNYTTLAVIDSANQVETIDVYHGEKYGNIYSASYFSTDGFVVGLDHQSDSLWHNEDLLFDKPGYVVSKFDNNFESVFQKNYVARAQNTCLTTAIDGSKKTIIGGTFIPAINHIGCIFGKDTLYCIGCLSEDSDCFIAVLDSNGEAVHAKRFGSIYWDYVNNVTTDKSSNIYATGSLWGREFYVDSLEYINLHYLSTADGFLVKFDSNLNAIWLKGLGNISYSSEFGDQLKSGASGELYWGASFYGNQYKYDSSIYTEGGPKGNAFIARLDTAGNMIWRFLFEGSKSYCRVNGMETDSNGNIWVAVGYHDTLSFAGLHFYNVESTTVLVQLTADGQMIQAYPVSTLEGTYVQSMQSIDPEHLLVCCKSRQINILNLSTPKAIWGDNTFYFILTLPPVATHAPPSRGNAMTLAPNPVHAGAAFQVRLSTWENEGPGLLSLFDCQGRLSHRQHCASEEWVQVPESLSTGVYFVQYLTDQGLYVQKLLIQD